MAVDVLARAIAAGKTPVDAYEMAVAGGYTGTKEQFEEDMGNSGTNATAAADSATAAAASATTAANAAGAIAPTYSPSATYAVGSYVLYNGALYKCSTDITTPEAWTAAHWYFVNVGSELGSLESAFDALGVVEFGTWLDGYSYLTPNAVATMQTNGMTTTAGMSCGYIPVAPGDRIHITGAGASGAKLWVFTGSDGSIISRANSNVSETDLELIAPAESAYMLFNADTNKPHYVVKGNNIASQIGGLPSIADQVTFDKEFKIDTLFNGFYNTTTGIKTAYEGWKCSEYLLPYRCDHDTIAYSTCGDLVQIVCFDGNYSKIDGYGNAIVKGTISTPRVIPKETRFIGVNIHRTDIPSLSFYLVPDMDVYEYPYTGTSYLANYWCNNSGVLESVNNMDSMLIQVQPGEKFYTNATIVVNFKCFNKSGTDLGTISYTEVATHGRIYTIPAGAVYCYINVQHNKTHGNYSSVYYKITKPEKILCVGDSVTYLDGREDTAFDNATLFLGYQKQLEKAGYQVVSAGFNGYAYGDDESHGSIYNMIVTEEYDVSGYDYIVLTGGLNDDLYGIPVGTVPANYSGNTYDTGTMSGALCGIIEYIRAHNTTCKIILCTPLKTESPNRPFSEAVQYADGISAVGQFESCKMVNVFEDMNVQPFSDGFDIYYYDSTHPGKAGMVRLGQLVLRGIETA